MNKEIIKSPDISKLKPVKIDERTTIYIQMSEDAEEAKEQYLLKLREKEKKFK